MTLHILWKAVSLHLLLWSTACERHCTFCERQSHWIFSSDQQQVSGHCTFCERQSHWIFSYDWQEVSNIAYFVKGSIIASFPMTNSLWAWVTLHIVCKSVSFHLSLWPTASEWHCTLFERQSHFIFSYDEQKVSDIAHWVKGSLIASFLMTNSKWGHCTFCERQSHCIFSYDQQYVSDIAHFVKGSHGLIAYFLWPTGSEWHCTFCERRSQSHCIFPYDQQQVSDIAHFVKAVSLHVFIWPTGSEWHCKFCERQSHCISSYDQQLVSDIAHCVNGSLIASFSMTNRKWVTLHVLWQVVSWHLFLWPTASEWHCKFCEMQYHCIFSYEQQRVSDIAHFVKGSHGLISCFPMTNSKWVTLDSFCERQSHCIFSYDQQYVSDIAHFVKGSLTGIASFPMTNSLWVTLHLLWKAVSLHLFL